jgi:hypothetical protein
MAVVGGDDDEGVVPGLLLRHSNRVRERDGVAQGPGGIAHVVPVVDAAAFDHQEETVRVPRQDVDGDPRHLGQRGFARRVARPVVVPLHVSRLEEAEQVLGRSEVERLELLPVPDVDRALARALPLLGEVASVGALARPSRVLGVSNAPGLEVRAATAEGHFEAITVGELDELPRDVGKARLPCGLGHAGVVLPEAEGHVGVAAGRRGVGHGGGGYHPGSEAALLCFLEDGDDPARFDALVIAADHALVDTQGSRQGLHAGNHGGHGGGRVRYLGVGVVGLGERDVGEFLEGEAVALTGFAAALAF